MKEAMRALVSRKSQCINNTGMNRLRELVANRKQLITKAVNFNLGHLIG